MLKFKDTHLLIIAEMGGKEIRYAKGRLEDYRFSTHRWFTLDHGKDFYATNTYQDDEGYKLLGWLDVPGNEHWRGCMSLPRNIELDADQQVFIKPIPQLQALREEHIAVNKDIFSVEGNRLEIILQMNAAGTNGKFGVMLEDGTNSYPILLDVASKTLTCINEEASLEKLDSVSNICLHIFIDHSVVEVFVNYRETMTTWFRPNLKPGAMLRLRPVCKETTINIWKLASSVITAP